jgi:lipopolysaccharide/colanic/teichoic acid biosynthesis glycosyltransferase
VIKLTSDGPALFRCNRVGQNGRPFVVYKLRSMVAEAPGIGPAITGASDSRVTPVGAVLRKLKLDELPQLLNVVKGDMSLVGPRPEDYRYVSLYSREQLEILDAKPGMTSPASLHYRDEAAQLVGDDWNDRYVQEIMPAKLAIDREYLGRRTVWSDVVVIFKTVWSLIGLRHPERGRQRVT